MKTKQFLSFFKDELWSIDKEDLPNGKRNLITILQVIILTVKEYVADKCDIKASGLTFYSLLSIVPILALGFAIARGFGYDSLLEQEIYSFLSGHEKIAHQAVEFANKMLSETKTGIIALTGIFVLLYSIMSLLNNIEEIFNQIWNIKVSRAIARKISDYLAIMLIAPLFIIISSSVTVYFVSEIKDLTSNLSLIKVASPFIFGLMKIIPYTLVWLAFSILFMVMPNTKVKIKSAIIAGIFAGTLYQLVQWGLINFQIGVSRYNAIYGSFAVLPLFLFWMQLSWSIVLLGCELAYSIQHINEFSFNKDKLNTSIKERKIIRIGILLEIINKYKSELSAPDPKSIQAALKIPLIYIIQEIKELEKNKLILETFNGHGESTYVPALDPDKISIAKVFFEMEEYGKANIDFHKYKGYKLIKAHLDVIQERIQNKEGDITLKNM